MSTYYDTLTKLGRMTVPEKTDLAAHMGVLPQDRPKKVIDVPLEHKHRALIDWAFCVRHPASAPLARCPHHPFRCDVYQEQFQFELPTYAMGVSPFASCSASYGYCTGLTLRKPLEYYRTSGSYTTGGNMHQCLAPAKNATAYLTDRLDSTLYLASSVGDWSLGTAQMRGFLCVPIANSNSTTTYIPSWFSQLNANFITVGGETRLLRTVALGAKFTLLGTSDARKGRLTVAESTGHTWAPDSQGTTLSRFIDQVVPTAGTTGARFPGVQVYALACGPNEYHVVWHPQVLADFQIMNGNSTSAPFYEENLGVPGSPADTTHQDVVALFSGLDANEKVLCTLTHVYEVCDGGIPGSGLVKSHEQAQYTGMRLHEAYEKGIATHHGGAGSPTTGPIVAEAVL